MLDRNKVIQEMENAQAYGEEFLKWIENSKVKPNLDQTKFISLALTKMVSENPNLISCANLLPAIVDIVFNLGYRSGWESAKTDTLLKQTEEGK